MNHPLPEFVIELFMGEWQIYNTKKAELLIPTEPINSKSEAENYLKKYLKNYEQPTTPLA